MGKKGKRRSICDHKGSGHTFCESNTNQAQTHIPQSGPPLDVFNKFVLRSIFMRVESNRSSPKCENVKDGGFVGAEGRMTDGRSDGDSVCFFRHVTTGLLRDHPFPSLALFLSLSPLNLMLCLSLNGRPLDHPSDNGVNKKLVEKK